MSSFFKIFFSLMTVYVLHVKSAQKSMQAVVQCPLLLSDFNPLNAELKPICHLMALLGVHLIFHISRIRVKRTRTDGGRRKHEIGTLFFKKRLRILNPLNAELNPICYLLALLGAHHFLHVNRIRVKSLTLRQLMAYIYIYIYMEHLFLMFLDHTQRRSTVGRTPLDE